MRVDRSRFLLIATALASGCGPRGAATAPPTPLAEPPDAGNADPPSAIGEAQLPPKTSTFEGGATSGGPSAEGYPSAEGAPWPSAEGGPAGEGAPPSLQKQGIPVSSWTCNGSDDAGNPPQCAVKIPKSCAPFPFIGQSCRGARRFFKPKIAERAVSCMHKLQPAAVCDAMVYDCRDAALRSACPDPSADAECNAIVAGCKKASMAECRTYLSGLNTEGRARVVQCMVTGCNYGVYSCVEGLND